MRISDWSSDVCSSDLEMTINLRGRDPELRLAQAAAQTGDVETALGHLKSSTIETSGDSALTAAEQWLQLAPLERERTAIYASGRALRTAVNEAVQRGLKANGELGKTSLDLTVLSRVNENGGASCRERVGQYV